jgi:hypothetical protein
MKLISLAKVVGVRQAAPLHHTHASISDQAHPHWPQSVGCQGLFGFCHDCYWLEVVLQLLPGKDALDFRYCVIWALPLVRG